MGTASHPPFTPNATGTQPAPAPLDELLRMLPDQYVQVLTQPAPATLAAQVEHADWRLIWVQLLGWSIASAVFGFFSRLLT